MPGPAGEEHLHRMTIRRRGPLRFDRPRVLGVAAVVAGVAGLGLVLGPGEPSTSPPTPAAGVAATTPRATTAPATTPSPPSGPTSPAAASASRPTTTAPSSSSRTTTSPTTITATSGWEVAARGFATAFTTTPAAGRDWVTGLAPWISLELQVSLFTTDPTRLPAGTLLQLQATTETADLVVATVLYDSGLQLAITVIPTAAPGPGWVVSTVLQVPTG